MDQLIFKFPFSKKYYEQDFFVSSNNFSAYKLIEEWPVWPGKWLNIYGFSGSGKTHLAKILEKKKFKGIKFNPNLLKDEDLKIIKAHENIILENFDKNINEKLIYTLLNIIDLDNKFIIVTSTIPVVEIDFSLKDLKSRMNSFIYIGIDLPTDDLLKVIISKNLSDKQININPKLSDYIINNVDRSYEKMFKFLKDVDELSLSTGKSININLIKKVLNQ